MSKFETVVRVGVASALIYVGCHATMACAEIVRKDRTTVSAPPMVVAPVIDGKITEGEWRGAAKFAGGKPYLPPIGVESSVDSRQFEAWIGYDENNIYIAFRTELPKDGNLIEGSKNVYFDDNVEIFLDPKGARVEGPQKFGFFQLLINSRGNAQMTQHEGMWAFSAWKPVFSQKHTLSGGFWEAEIVIAVTSLGLDRLTCPAEIGFALARNFKQPKAAATMVPGGGYGFLLESERARLLCREDSPVVQVSFPDWESRFGRSMLTTIYNPTHESVTVDGHIGKEGDGTSLGEIAVLPGETKTIARDYKDESPICTWDIRVNQGGQPVYYRDIPFETMAKKKWTNMESSMLLSIGFGKDGVLDQQGEEPEGGIWDKLKTKQGTDGRFAGWLTGGASLSYPNLEMKLPCAIYVEAKSGNAVVDGSVDRSQIWVVSSGVGTISLIETAKQFELIVEGVSWPKTTAGYGIVYPKPKLGGGSGFYRVLVSFGESSAIMNVDGVVVGEIRHPRWGAAFKALRVGESESAVDLALRSLRVIDRDLNDYDLIALGLERQQIAFTGGLSYFPSLGQLVADASILQDDLPTNAVLTLELHDSVGACLKTYPIDIAADFTQGADNKRLLRKRFNLPALADGVYRMFITFSAGGQSSRCLERTFEVKKYAWADNTLGLSTTLVPPFTPLKVNSNEVSCLLKRYVLSDSGLPEKIFADGSEILSGPVELVVMADGEQQGWGQSRLKFTERSAHTVKYSSASQNDLLNLDIEGDFDYDGFLKLRLRFTPKKSDSIDRMYLDIPVRKEFAKLFHAAGTGNRKNPTGLLPPGRGVIWGSRSLPHTFPNFVPYVWVGEEGKGVCYLADTDVDWLLNGARDAVEVIRDDDGTVRIRLNLVNARASLGRERSIELGLMATPVKPMPEGWRGWADGADRHQFAGNTFLHCSSTGVYWGDPYGASGVYPLQEDFEIIRKLDETRKTGVIDEAFRDAYLEKIVSSWKQGQVGADFERLRGMYDGSFEENIRKFWDMHLKQGFALARAASRYKNSGTLWSVYFGCMAEQRVALPEFPVYRDEWGGSPYDPCPSGRVVKSFRDYAAYYANEMVKNGVDGLYLDNTCMASGFLWPTGDGYIDAEGKLHESVGAWRIRAHVKRLATLLAEKGKKPFVIVHMTNSLGVPLYSFAQATIGEEWKYGLTDYQDRFSPDYFRAICMGRQLGAFPEALGGIFGTDQAKAEWAVRTMLAAQLPHEIQATMNVGTGAGWQTIPIMQRAWKILYDFGRAEHDCRFYGYWTSAIPAKPGRDDLLLSCYVRGNKLLLVAGDYGDGSVKSTAIHVDSAALGFSKVVAAVNKETNASLDIKDGSTVMLPLKKHDFALIEVTMQK